MSKIRMLLGMLRGGLSLGSIKTGLMALGGVIVAILVILARWGQLIRREEQGKQLKHQLEAERDAREIILRDRAIAAERPGRDGVRRALKDGSF